MIINASPLIIFGKLNKIELLKKIYSTIEITNSVYQEVVIRGIEKNSSEAHIIKEHIYNCDIKIINLTDKFITISKKIEIIYNIDIGEADTIALGLQLNRKEIIIDEISARHAVKSLGIKPIGTLRVLLLAYKKGLINEPTINELINEMVNSKYRFSPKVLIEFWNLFEKLKQYNDKQK